MEYSLRQLADHLIDAKVHGDADCCIRGTNTIQHAVAGEIAFLANRRYARLLPSTKASAVILSVTDLPNCPTNALLVQDPYLAYAKIANLIYKDNPIFSVTTEHRTAMGEQCKISQTAYIGPNVVIGRGVEIGDGSYIGPGSVIGDNVFISRDCYLAANISVCHNVKLGQAVILHPGVVIGSDGFGLARGEQGWIKIPHTGSVHIEDQVEIGANTTIDRGVIHNTLIGKGVKIDNQVQIAHNVTIGEYTVIAGCAAVAGSTKIGRRCMIGGATIIGGHLCIADDVVITGASTVSRSIETPGVYSSTPLIMERKAWNKNIVRFKKLDRMARKLSRLSNSNTTD